MFDIGSNVLLWWLHRKAERLDVNRWPVGGARLETIGNIIYGAGPSEAICLTFMLTQSKVSCEFPATQDEAVGMNDL